MDERRRALLTEVRRTMDEVRDALERFGIGGEDEAALRESTRRLEELFLLVIVGEFNAGKSAFINALVGSRVLKEGVTPTTSAITLLKYGPAAAVTTDGEVDVVQAPMDLLREMTIVDTPGTNAIERRHEAITREFVPRADFVFFVTSADRPFTESERAFLERIREWGKSVVLVVNKADILEEAAAVGQIESFIRDNARTLLQFTPEVFSVSARRALEARQTGNRDALASSGFERLQCYIDSRLNEAERFRLKLLNPLGVGQRLLEAYTREVESRLKLLQQDLATLDEIERQMAVYREDLRKGFELRLANIDNILLQIEKRGDEFFEETVRLARVFDLVNKSKVQEEFSARVIADAPLAIERRVNDMIDWLLTADLQQWQALKEQLDRRRAEHPGRIAGDQPGGFEVDRSRLLESLGRTAQSTLEGYDRQAEGRRIAESVQEAVAGAALLQVGAIGLGTVVTLAATTTAVDVTGLLAAGSLATIGFFVIPRRRRSAKRELREKVEDLRQRLMRAMRAQFEIEMERSLRRLDESLMPYSRFVRAEREGLNARLEQFRQLRQRIVDTAARVRAQ